MNEGSEFPAIVHKVHAILKAIGPELHETVMDVYADTKTFATITDRSLCTKIALLLMFDRTMEECDAESAVNRQYFAVHGKDHPECMQAYGRKWWVDA